jgi:hypothetical protein
MKILSAARNAYRIQSNEGVLCLVALTTAADHTPCQQRPNVIYHQRVLSNEFLARGSDQDEFFDHTGFRVLRSADPSE